MNSDVIESRLNILKSRPFRARFHLGPKEKAIVEAKGLDGLRDDAMNLLVRRIFVAFPFKDGKQTPYRGHPVFVAQHATATCCRTCLMRWHKIPRSRDVTPEQQEYILDVIETWVRRDLDR
jgi:hypothetical protein